MKFTSNKLIEIILSSWIDPNKLVDLLFLVSKLIKKYGKMLFNQKYIKEISSINKDLWDIINILNIVDKKSYNDVKFIIILIKKVAENYFLKFSINSDSSEHNKLIENYIKNKFTKSKVELDTKWKLWISVSWEWRYYRKDLDSDLKKILWK